MLNFVRQQEQDHGGDLFGSGRGGPADAAPRATGGRSCCRSAGRAAARSPACRCSPDAPSCSGCCTSSARSAGPRALVRAAPRPCWRSRPSHGGAAQAEHRGDVDDRAAAWRFFIAGIAALQPRKVPSPLMSLTRRNSASVQSSIELRTPTPAAFRSPCRPPNVLDRCRYRLVPGCLSSVTSSGTKCARVAKLAARARPPGLVAVGQHRLAALAHDQPRRRRADARGAAAHEHDLVLKARQRAASSSGRW